MVHLSFYNKYDLGNFCTRVIAFTQHKQISVQNVFIKELPKCCICLPAAMNPLANAWAIFPAPINPILIIVHFLFSWVTHRSALWSQLMQLVVEHQASANPSQNFVSHWCHAHFLVRSNGLKHLLLYHFKQLHFGLWRIYAIHLTLRVNNLRCIPFNFFKRFTFVM